MKTVSVTAIDWELSSWNVEVLAWIFRFNRCTNKVDRDSWWKILKTYPYVSPDQVKFWFGTLPLQMLIVSSLWQAYVDKAFNNEILALDVKCKNNEWGCKWEGEFQNYQVSYADCVLLILANKNNFKARNRLCYKHWLRVLINASCWRLFKCFLHAW